jgi:hypothetical protein
MHIPGKSILLVISRIERSLALLIRGDRLYLREVNSLGQSLISMKLNAVLEKITVKKMSAASRTGVTDCTRSGRLARQIKAHRL